MKTSKNQAVMPINKNQAVMSINGATMIDENDPVFKMVEMLEKLDYRKLHSSYRSRLADGRFGKALFELKTA